MAAVTHACNPSTLEARQEDYQDEFQISLRERWYPTKQKHQQKNNKKNPAGARQGLVLSQASADPSEDTEVITPLLWNQPKKVTYLLHRVTPDLTNPLQTADHPKA